LAIRRRIAERIATPLKRAGVETPVLEQIPHRAEELAAFYYEPVHQSSRGQIAELIRIPAFAHGKAYGETAGFWYRVTFPRPINNPNVVAVAEGRRGEIPTVKAPRITIPTVDLPTIPPITIPDIVIPRVPTSLGRFECGWAIKSLTDGLNDLIVVLEGVLVRVNEIIDKTSDAVKKVRDNVKDVYDSLTDFRGKVQTALNKYRDNIESSVNTGLGGILPALYAAWGIPSNMAVTPLHIRNVTASGFEFQSFGRTTCHWICLGTR